MPNALESYVVNAAAAAFAAGGTYLRQSAEQVELSVQDRPGPFVILYDFTTTTATASARAEAAALTLYFATSRPGAGDDPLAHQAAVLDMDALRRRFLAALDRYPVVQLDGIRVTPFQNFTSAELDGVGCQFTLTLPAGHVCPPLPIPEPATGYPYVLDFVLTA